MRSGVTSTPRLRSAPGRSRWAPEDGSDAFARQVDFEENAIPSFGARRNGAFGEPQVPMRTIDPELGNTVDILA